MATRGRPKGVDTQMIHVRIPVTLHKQLDVLQAVTKKTTSDVVRELLDRYVLTHGELLAAVEKTLGEAKRVYTQAEIDAQEWGQLENDEEAAKPENHYGSKEEWENN
jgi:predicted DNA-binding protein